MEMQVDPVRIRTERERRAWSQSHLAAVAGLGHRTVQRIEATGNASYESAAAIATVFSLTVADLVPTGATAASAAQIGAEPVESHGVPPEIIAVAQSQPSRKVLQLAVAAVVVVTAALIFASIQTPGTDVAGREPAVSQTLTGPVAANDAPIVNCPVPSGWGRPRLNLDIECETVDPDWAPAVERQLRSVALGYLSDWPDLSERYSLAGVRCRSTICEMRFVDSAPTGLVEIGPNNPHPDEYLWRQLHLLRGDIHAEPWGAQFDPWRTMSIGSIADGEQRMYVQRLESQLARL